MHFLCYITDNVGDTLNLALVQYFFSEGEHKLLTAPHGNSHYRQPYIRTMPSVMCKVKEEARKSTPKCALQFVSSQAGGILHATSAGALPSNCQQVKDAQRKCTGKQAYDPLYAVMHMCKEGEGRGEGKFIRMVNAAPHPMMLIAMDYTLDSTLTLTTLASLVWILHSTLVNLM